MPVRYEACEAPCTTAARKSNEPQGFVSAASMTYGAVTEYDAVTAADAMGRETSYGNYDPREDMKRR